MLVLGRRLLLIGWRLLLVCRLGGRLLVLGLRLCWRLLIC